MAWFNDLIGGVVDFFTEDEEEKRRKQQQSRPQPKPQTQTQPTNTRRIFNEEEFRRPTQSTPQQRLREFTQDPIPSRPEPVVADRTERRRQQLQEVLQPLPEVAVTPDNDDRSTVAQAVESLGDLGNEVIGAVANTGRVARDIGGGLVRQGVDALTPEIPQVNNRQEAEAELKKIQEKANAAQPLNMATEALKMILQGTAQSGVQLGLGGGEKLYREMGLLEDDQHLAYDPEGLMAALLGDEPIGSIQQNAVGGKQTLEELGYTPGAAGAIAGLGVPLMAMADLSSGGKSKAAKELVEQGLESGAKQVVKNTDEINRSLEWYRNGGHRTVNNQLRSGKPVSAPEYMAGDMGFTEATDDTIRNLDELTSAPLDEPITVHRGIGAYKEGDSIDKWANAKVGDTITDKGFVSAAPRGVKSRPDQTSKEYAAAAYTDARNPVIVEINAPKGTKAHIVNEDIDPEVIFGRNQNFKVIDKTTEIVNGKETTIIKTEVVPQADDLPLMTDKTVKSDLVREWEPDPRTIDAKSNATVDEYKRAIQNGEEIQPISVHKRIGKTAGSQEIYDVDDGHHRMRAYRELGIDDIPIHITNKDQVAEFLQKQDNRIADAIQAMIDEGVIPEKNMDKALTKVAELRGSKTDNLPLINGKERKFVDSTRQADVVADDTQALIDEDPRRLYEPQTNKGQLAQADARINDNLEEAVSYAMRDEVSGEHTATQMQLIRKFSQEGNHERASDLALTAAEQLTAKGQAVQAASIISRLSPEGSLLYAQKQIRKAAAKTDSKKLAQVDEVTKEIERSTKQLNSRAADAVAEQIDEAVAAGETLKPRSPRKPSTATKAEAEKKADEIDRHLAKGDLADAWDAATGSLASKVGRHAKDPKPKDPDPLRDMVNQLYAVAKEDLPKLKKKVPKNEYEMIRAALQNPGDYQAMWYQARDLVYEKWKDVPEAMERLDKYFESIYRPYPTTQVDKILRDALKQNNVKLGDLVRDFYKGQAQTGQDLSDYIMAKLPGVSKADARQLENVLADRFDEVTKGAREKELTRIFAERKIPARKELADSIIEWSNLGALSRSELHAAIAKKLGLPALSPDLAKRIQMHAQTMQELPEGRAKEVAVAEMMRDIANQIPSTKGQKLSTIQTIAMLLNPKTAIRNIIGNSIFAGAENIKDVLATPLDAVVSLATGKRTKYLPSISTQARGLKKGFQMGVEDVRKGINTSPSQTKFDLPRGQVFKSGIGVAAEKTLNYILRVPDRAGYQAAFDESFRQYVKANNITDLSQIPDEAFEVAHMDALYRTFQDDSRLAKGLLKIRGGLNDMVGTEDFGLGDFVLKFARTPANLVSRGFSYSPVGFVDAAYHLLRPAIGKGFDQKAFVEATSRALTGTVGLTGVGYYLAGLGIISGRSKETDYDIPAFEREQGEGNYKINLSALGRWFMSGFDDTEAKAEDGDKLISYDWAQPAAMSIALGADIKNSETQDGKLSSVDPMAAFGSIGESVSSAANSLVEQPVLQGIQDLFGGFGGPTDGLATIAEGAPASFVPTSVRQIRDMIDPYSRNTDDAAWHDRVVNRVIDKVPGLSQMLPTRLESDGEPELKYKTGNDPVNVLLNPAILTELKRSDEGKYIAELFEETGEKGVVPRRTPKSIDVNGETMRLTNEQQHAYQNYVGQITNQLVAKLIDNPQFMAISPAEQAGVIEDIHTQAATAARVELFGHRPNRKPKASELRIIRQEDPEPLPLYNR